MNDNNLEMQAAALQVSASKEMIAKTLKDHRDHYSHWAKKGSRSSGEDEPLEIIKHADQSGPTLQT